MSKQTLDCLESDDIDDDHDDTDNNHVSQTICGLHSFNNL